MKKHWNYRILRFTHKEEDYFQLHEVHYEDGVPVMYGKEAAINIGDSTDDLKKNLEKMERALKEPILDTENWPKEYEDHS